MGKEEERINTLEVGNEKLTNNVIGLSRGGNYEVDLLSLLLGVGTKGCMGRMATAWACRAQETMLLSLCLPETPLLAKPAHQPKRNKDRIQVGKMEHTCARGPNCTKQR